MILLIDNYDSFTYNLVQRFGELNPHLPMQVFRNDQITLDQVGVNPKTHEVIKHIQACEDKLVEYRLTVDREWKMVKGSVTWLVVKCDVVRQDDAMTTVTIDDWKTGKTKAPAYKEQMELYRVTAASISPLAAIRTRGIRWVSGRCNSPISPDGCAPQALK